MRVRPNLARVRPHHGALRPNPETSRPIPGCVRSIPDWDRPDLCWIRPSLPRNRPLGLDSRCARLGFDQNSHEVPPHVCGWGGSTPDTDGVSWFNFRSCILCGSFRGQLVEEGPASNRGYPCHLGCPAPSAFHLGCHDFDSDSDELRYCRLGHSAKRQWPSGYSGWPMTQKLLDASFRGRPTRSRDRRKLPCRTFALADGEPKGCDKDDRRSSRRQKRVRRLAIARAKEHKPSRPRAPQHRAEDCKPRTPARKTMATVMATTLTTAMTTTVATTTMSRHPVGAQSPSCATKPTDQKHPARKRNLDVERPDGGAPPRRLAAGVPRPQRAARSERGLGGPWVCSRGGPSGVPPAPKAALGTLAPPWAQVKARGRRSMPSFVEGADGNTPESLGPTSNSTAIVCMGRRTPDNPPDEASSPSATLSGRQRHARLKYCVSSRMARHTLGRDVMLTDALRGRPLHKGPMELSLGFE